MKVFFSNADILVYNEKNVSKTFKKLLTTQRMISTRRNIKDTPNDNQNKVERRRTLKNAEANQVINKEVEKKYQKKLGTLPIT
jgi:hypothetical protein